ncbi:unnamed protein product [Didymodactylos carnosus]|uniref:Peptidase C1A papain C-terminal domain-containing protein n=1 Tax=Didymodactylos carnosus TaxID=1234261 RepID=A0A815QDP0_9BILA|nr:unnamed protein product [Didymodactylos carnosus]CAF4331814.1 unnamed protein product [Didymodactylos carnosus]
MTLKTFLTNRRRGTRYRLNGITQSTFSPSRWQPFSNIRKLTSAGELPAKVDLRPQMTPVEDQSQIGSCSANALAGAYEYLVKQHLNKDTLVSRLFIYYNGRQQEGEGDITDSGCTMSAAIEALEAYGTCGERLWPYDISAVNTKPSQAAYTEAKQFIVDEALSVQIELNEMKSCLAQGFPFTFGIMLFHSFDDAASGGVVPMPSGGQQGGHALLCVGYSDQSNSFIVRNSWGESWGDNGYCYIPYDYMTNTDYTFDAWTIRKLSSDDFGQDAWDNDDSVDYTQNAGNDADAGNGAIEDVDDDLDSGGDFQSNDYGDDNDNNW